MENDPNPMPEVKILRCPVPIEGIARAISRALHFLPDQPLSRGDHFVHDTGAEAMLAGPPELDFEA